ncbi:PQQ-binding-like beta-propeller repeat protein, partial [bacterium]|nr:PQQ-binding-like beta-propeller repeat protein [bacterium]
IAAGVGRVYACGFGFFGGLGWSLDVGGDLNGTMPLTNDNHLLLGIEKQFINGRGGVMKFEPKGGVKWYYPLPDRKWYTWNGGLVGSPAVNHRYQSDVSKDLACFVGIDGVLTLINHKQVQPGVVVPGPRGLKQYPTPLVLDRVELPQGSISTPLFVGNKIIVGYDNGMDLYQVTPAGKLQRLDRLSGPMFDATPIVWNGRVYAGSKNGNLYCLGN